MIDEAKLREAFEAHMADNGKWPQAIEKSPGGNYKYLPAATAWLNWQACAQALAAQTATAQVSGDEWGMRASHIGHWSDGPETFVIVQAKDVKLGSQTYGPPLEQQPESIGITGGEEPT